MRKVVHIAAGLFLIACGPDPNAVLPGQAAPSTSGGARASGGVITSLGGAAGTITGNGGVTSSGGSTVVASGGVVNPFSGGTTGTNGGIVSSGGLVSSGGTTTSPFGNGGVASGGGLASSGGVASSGGTTLVFVQGGSSGSGGATTASSGALTTYTFGSGSEPCTPIKDVSGGQSGNLGTGAVCLRTADDFSSWNCSSMDDRTVKINNVSTKCGAAPPPKVGSFYYFDVSAGATAWASFSWFCNVQGCLGAHPIPSCGHYPPWVSGGSAAPCADTGTTPASDAAAP
jgi:hypothetical protein